MVFLDSEVVVGAGVEGVVVCVTLVISIAKAKFVETTESADEPEGFECEVLSSHKMKSHFDMSFCWVFQHDTFHGRTFYKNDSPFSPEVSS